MKVILMPKVKEIVKYIIIFNYINFKYYDYGIK